MICDVSLKFHVLFHTVICPRTVLGDLMVGANNIKICR